MSLDGLNRALLPAIVLLEDNRACVLTEITPDGTAVVIFPELPDGETRLSKDQLHRQYLGHAIYCKPIYRAEKRARSLVSNDTGHWFWHVLAKNRPLYRDVLLASLLINILALGMPLFVMNVYDRVVPNHATHTLWVLAIGLLVVLAADLALRLVRTWFVDLAALRVDTQASSAVMQKVLGIGLAHKPASTGALTTSVQGFESVRSFISSLTILALIDLPFSLLFILIIAWIGWPLVFPIIIGALLLLLYAASVQRRLKAMADATMTASSQRNSILIESVSNLETVKSFNAEGQIQRTYETSTLEVARQGAAMRLLSGSVSQGAAWAQHSVAVMIVIIGVYLLIDGQLSQGGLIAAYLLSSRVMAPISQAAGLMAQYHNAATAMETLDRMMALPQERPAEKEWINRPTMQGKIEFRNVSFKYPNEERYALRNVSFTIQPGEHLVILGKNGSGKSTLQRLMLNLYQPESGSVLFDGVDVRQLDPAYLRRQIGYVPQDIHLMYGTLRSNILLNNPAATDEALLNAATLSGLEGMVSQHPAGFDLLIGENGYGLSGGQRRTVGVARALINDPPIMILDEPTESLDHSAESLLCRNLKTACSGRTMVTITHRSMLLELASRIIVLDNGQVVADGPKQDVIDALKSGRVSGGSA